MWEKVFLLGCLMFHDLRAELILAKLLIPWSIDVSVHRKGLLVSWKTDMDVLMPVCVEGVILIFCCILTVRVRSWMYLQTPYLLHYCITAVSYHIALLFYSTSVIVHFYTSPILYCSLVRYCILCVSMCRMSLGTWPWTLATGQPWSLSGHVSVCCWDSMVESPLWPVVACMKYLWPLMVSCDRSGVWSLWWFHVWLLNLFCSSALCPLSCALCPVFEAFLIVLVTLWLR